MKRKTVIGLAASVLLAGVSRIDAEPLDRMARQSAAPTSATSAVSPAPARVQSPPSLRRLVDSFLRLPIAPVEPSPVKRCPLGLAADDVDLPSCDEVLDPSIPCRVATPVGG